MSIYVNLCQFMSFSANSWQFSWIYVNSWCFLLICVNTCPFLSIIVHSCPLLSIHVQSCSFLSILNYVINWQKLKKKKNSNNNKPISWIAFALRARGQKVNAYFALSEIPKLIMNDNLIVFQFWMTFSFLTFTLFRAGVKCYFFDREASLTWS